MPSITLLVKGAPVPKGRPRFNHNTGNVYTPKETRDAEKALGILLRAAGARPDPDHNYQVVLTFVLEDDAATDGIDLDNLVKLVLDSANKIAWKDDRQVTSLQATVTRTNLQRPFTLIQINEGAHREARRRSPSRRVQPRTRQPATSGRLQPDRRVPKERGGPAADAGTRDRAQLHQA
jgi:crossover junction endodeoxyribonuclease RusA